ncbi:ATP-binding protein [Shewanella sp. Isolate8]|uniref:AAA family ATPase n=1 Tax=Shewanella sp. Isolate8 TaxID=2908529 RepID=UPI001EFC3E4D|nr:ATP-binding protein [Shewanella sp. Isolate8]MCG9745207.1 ATP-binding protein [Shewanella sp. Isolate8]
MTHKGKLFLFCGKMGAGKSTKARLIADENGALLLSEDEWLAAHFPDQIESFDDYIHYSILIKPFIRNHVARLINVGTNVVMDFPANTRKQRQWFVSLCNELACEHQLIYLDLSDQRCLAQIDKRRQEQPERARFDNEAVFRQVTQYFEPPTDDEGLNILLVAKEG